MSSAYGTGPWCVIIIWRGVSQKSRLALCCVVWGASPTPWVSPHIFPQLVRPPETLQCRVGWPTSLTGEERPGGSSSGE
ncbi:hypothetical protein BYT27DRAFT_7255488 [Phlegmacium glaucopus]|nr:hypothetical protein BYT27DRAFT_7255488 [Phlegmacium glaucopus]